ncbi:hypothetical protein JHK85_003300 [Glycine max]|uniref:Uncharacterized protein n=1 Tax=Glycine max TaxID=3847 RepID=K7K6D0_SOYBN|nr:hypothetical protein JHK85_003300 [Glycine max]KAG5079071.1 hypothetical protein JHK86_003136 [Glycine max]KAH1058630.1 hypothetical protein GYH30_002957 [Glycine max]
MDNNYGSTLQILHSYFDMLCLCFHNIVSSKFSTPTARPSICSCFYNLTINQKLNYRHLLPDPVHMLLA